MKKILITGANGFLGSHIISQLLSYKDYNVFGLVRKSSDLSLLKRVNGNLTLLYGDVNDIPSLESAFEGMDYVIHTASYVSYEAGKMPLMQKVNVEGTANVINIALFRSVKKLVHVSSVAAIAKKAEARLYDENSKWARSPLNLDYGISKYQAEQEVWRGIQEGLRATIINPSLILGKGDYNRSSTEIINKIKISRGLYPSGVNGFVDVKDVARACISALDAQYDGERFIICSENLSYQNIYKMIYKGLGMDESKLRPMPELFKSFLNRVNSLVEPIFKRSILLSTQTMRYTNTISRCDNTKSISMLGIHYTPIRETIADMTKDYLAKSF